MKRRLEEVSEKTMEVNKQKEISLEEVRNEQICSILVCVDLRKASLLA